MKGFLIGLVAGVILTIVTLIPLQIRKQEEQYRSAMTNGMLVGRLDAAIEIENEFGSYTGKGPYTVLFSVKTTDVISIETNGVKTVRVIP